MTNYSFANLDKWVAKTERRMTAVVRQSATDMLNDIKVVPGKMRGGTPQRGEIPRDLGFLANSLVSTLLGSTAIAGAGEDSFVMVIGSMQAGDVATFVWTADYARAVHYGSNGKGGTFWVDVAANKWPDYVSRSVKRAIAQVG